MDELVSLIDQNHKYIKAGEEELGAFAEKFLDGCHIVELLKSGNIWRNLDICDKSVAKIVDLVRRRRLYFHVYHSTNGLSELKESSLYAFWILKLQPFYWKTATAQGSNYEINAKVALNFFLKGLSLYVKEKTEDERRCGSGRKYSFNTNPEAIQGLYYSFRYHDISKEFLVAAAENLIIVK
jgi:hypothetical protein